MILTPSQKLPNNLGKLSVATGFEWLPKGQKISQSGLERSPCGGECIQILLEKLEYFILKKFLNLLKQGSF